MTAGAPDAIIRVAMAGEPGMAAAAEDDAALVETLEALELPLAGLLDWFEHTRAFCEAHGGRRVYGELLELVDGCERATRKRRPEAR